MVETTIIQQLNTLSLKQLQEVKKTVNTLIRSKRRSEELSRRIDLGDGSYSRSSSSKLPAEQYYSQLQIEKERANLYNELKLAAASALRQRNNSSSSLEPSDQELTTESLEKVVGELVDKIDKIFVTADSPVPEKESESLRKESESLGELIGFVNEWMSDESGHDETIYPQIEAALQKDQLSL